MTSNVEIGLEASNVFQALSKGEVVEHTRHLLVAPKCLQNKVLICWTKRSHMQETEKKLMQDSNLIPLRTKDHRQTDRGF